MKRCHFISSLTLLLTGCIPLRQEVRIVGPPNPHVDLCDDQFLLVEIDLRQEAIVSSASYIISPDGRRYTILSVPHQFDLDQQYPVLRGEVYLYDRTGARLRKWKNGVWTFHWVVKGNFGTETIDQRWKYWTFYYNPLLHGAPN